MAPKAAQKTPTTGGKAPAAAGKAPVEKKEAGKKTAAPSGDKKKRTKTRKETYSSYIYKGTPHFHFIRIASFPWSLHLLSSIRLFSHQQIASFRALFISNIH
jgi:hypothetical protein